MIEKVLQSVSLKSSVGVQPAAPWSISLWGVFLSDCKSNLITCKLCSTSNIKLLLIYEVEFIIKTTSAILNRRLCVLLAHLKVKTNFPK